MSLPKSYFKLDFFKTKITDIDTTFTCSSTFEQYTVELQPNALCFNSKKYEPYSTWISFFDSPQNNVGVNLMFQKIKSFFDLTTTLKTESNIESILVKYISEYETLSNYHPFFLMFFKQIYKVINSLLTNSLECDDEIDSLLNSLNKLLNNYVILFDYVKNVLVEPYQHGLECGTGLCVVRYEQMLIKNSQPSPLFITPQDKVCDWNKELANMVIETIFSHLNCTTPDTLFACKNDIDFSLEFSRGIEYFINNDFILKQCPNCKGYFKTKRSLLVSYCNRRFKNNLTCQEIGAKIKYKEKLNTHPIHIEYTKMYNKIYARIRRNSLLKEDAKLDELKSLHNFYYAKYEKSHPDIQNDIIQEFIDSMNSLYQ